jgi:hypothetical protein
MEAVAGVAISAERMLAVNWDPLTKLVALGLPFQVTSDPDTKPVPFTVSTNAGPPGMALVGTNGWLTRGTGLAKPTPLDKKKYNIGAWNGPRRLGWESIEFCFLSRWPDFAVVQ